MRRRSKMHWWSSYTKPQSGWGSPVWHSACGAAKAHAVSDPEFDAGRISCHACLDALLDRLIARRAEIGMPTGTKGGR